MTTLDCVRHDCPTDQTVLFQHWVIQVSISDEFHELQEPGQSPEKCAAKLAMKCSPHLTFEVHELVCIEVDKTSGTLSGTKKLLSNRRSSTMTVI